MSYEDEEADAYRAWLEYKQESLSPAEFRRFMEGEADRLAESHATRMAIYEGKCRMSGPIRFPEYLK